MDRRILGWGTALLLGALTPACTDITVSGGVPVSLEISVDRTRAAVGEDVGVTIDARGMSLNGVVVDYGDGAADSLAAFGAVSARTRFEHRYEAAGTYVIRGRAEDGPGSTARDSVTVVVGGD